MLERMMPTDRVIDPTDRVINLVPHQLARQRPGEPHLAREATLDHATLLNNGIFGFEYLDVRAQPFALLRSQLMRRLAPTGGRIIAVSSTQPHNGKSFVAANLAASLSQIHPVYLIDLDLRRPTVGTLFGLPACAGADDYLLGQQDIAEAGCNIAGNKLKIVPVRQPLDNSADLLASARGTQLFEALRNAPGAPICIIDTPPVLEGDDMMIVAKHVDGVLLVVEEGRTRQRELRETLRMLHPTPLLGTVLNKAIGAPTSSGYYGYGGYRRNVASTPVTRDPIDGES